jgi:Holliday junction resolvasome RuvABC endonuclease subunit
MGLDLSTSSDPAKSRTGWAVLEGDGLRAAGRFPEELRGWRKLSPTERILATAREVLQVIQSHAPSWIYAESPYVGKFAKAIMALGKLQGAVVYAASLAGREINWVTCGEWRRLIGAGPKRGKASGLAVVEGWLVMRGLPWAHYSLDEIEAIGVALAGRIELQANGVE